MDHRELGQTGFSCSRLGWGALKIGRNQGIKFPAAYPLPDEASARSIVDGMLDAGITFIDTAPSYGLSEERLGIILGDRRRNIILSTKVGETFSDGRSQYDFSSEGIETSLRASLQRLRTAFVDIVWVHSDGHDEKILNDPAVRTTLHALRERGLTRAIGFSGKTVDGNRKALREFDAIMVEYHLEDRSQEAVIAEAEASGVGVVLKKALRSGHLPAEKALHFVLHDSPVASAITSVVIGSLSPKRMAANIRLLEGS